jgi:hypothetical protein
MEAGCTMYRAAGGNGSLAIVAMTWNKMVNASFYSRI